MTLVVQKSKTLEERRDIEGETLKQALGGSEELQEMLKGRQAGRSLMSVGQGKEDEEKNGN